MKNQEKVKFNPNETVYCEMKRKNRGNPFEVGVLSITKTGKTAEVMTTSGSNKTFKTSTSNLFNAIPFHF
jgi:hypothetical protein